MEVQEFKLNPAKGDISDFIKNYLPISDLSEKKTID
jgi:hypothetical protein